MKVIIIVRIVIFCVSLWFLHNPVLAQQPIDTVFAFQFGTNTNFGQSPDFFPKNIFGWPSRSASELTPVSSEDSLVSLGLGGWMTVGIKNSIIINGPGEDFIVFENVFWPGGDSMRAFQEPAIVSVSENGEEFVTFPYDSITFAGLAGLRPTFGAVSIAEFPQCGGDGFDLSLIGIDSVRFIRLEDRSRWVNGGSGFDLDAVVALNVANVPTGIDMISIPEQIALLAVFPNPFNPSTTIEWQVPGNQVQLTVYDLLGQPVFSQASLPFSGSTQLDLKNSASGIYWVVISSDQVLTSQKIVLIK